MHYLALDIETCPLPADGYSAQQQVRLEREVHFQRQRDPNLSEDQLAHRAASLHPLLSWIVCISVQRAKDDPSQPNDPYSYLAASPNEEADMLSRFWNDIRKLVERNEEICWITFNGKRFDVPFLLARTLHHNLIPVSCGLLQDYPYKHYPHCDLFNLFTGINLGLADLCVLLEIPNPKENADGAHVEQLLAKEGIEAVQRYCEADVRATMKCFARLLPLLPSECQPRNKR